MIHVSTIYKPFLSNFVESHGIPYIVECHHTAEESILEKQTLPQFKNFYIISVDSSCKSKDLHFVLNISCCDLKKQELKI